MKLRLNMSFFVLPAIVGLLCLSFARPVVAQDEPAEKAEPTIEEKLTVPEDASVEDLEKFIVEAQRFMPGSIRTMDEYLAFQAKQTAAIDKAVDLILASDDLTPKAKRTALTARIQSCLRNSQGAEAMKTARETLEKIIADEKDDEEMKDVVDNAQAAIFQIRLNAFTTRANRSIDEFEQLDKDIRAYYAEKPGVSRFANAIMETATTLYADAADKKEILGRFEAAYMAMLTDAEKTRFETTLLQIRLNAFSRRVNTNIDEFEQLDKDIRAYYADKPGVSNFANTMLETALSLYADADDKKEIIDRFEAAYMALLSDAEKSRFEGLVRRLKLPGNEMEFETVTIDVKKLIADADGAEDFDVMAWVEDQPAEKLNLKSLEGKVVLVDCWATWCGPCLMEVPNMLVQYEKYHDKGFEIIGYSCDQSVEALLKFVIKENPPWIIGSTVLSDKEDMKNYLNHYGVTGIPTMILIGRNGKVISTAARGQTLNKLLEEQFAEAE